MRSSLSSFLALLLFACTDLRASGEPDGGPPPDAPSDGGLPVASGAFRHEVREDGSVVTTADATDETRAVYLDLETGLATDADGPWDLGLRRYFVTTNGGVSGDDGGAATRIEGATFEAIVRAPETGWRADGPDTDTDTDDGPDTAFNGGVDGADDWYDYDPATHRLSPRDAVFAVRSGEGRFYAIQMLGYYDDAGTPAWPSFRWRPIEGGAVTVPDAGPVETPDAAVDGGTPIDVPDDAIEIDASSREDWVYYDVETARVVSVADPATSTIWDLALRRSVILTNSGASGPGVGGARATELSAPGEVESTGTLGFVVDAPAPGADPATTSPVLADWFLYDPATHTLSARPTVYVIRTGEGGYARLRVWAWADGVYQLSVAPIERVVETVRLVVDATSTTEWAYLDLTDAGPVADVTTPETDPRWDLALRRTALATSSGTSGPGAGGALDAMTSFEATTAIPDDGFTVDALLPLPGPPGSGTYSGNAALGTWYDYDPTTHVVSPRATTFLVRLRDGSAGKLAVRTWTGGTFELDWAWAGPGRRTL